VTLSYLYTYDYNCSHPYGQPFEMCYSPRLFIFLLDDKKIFKKFLAANPFLGAS